MKNRLVVFFSIAFLALMLCVLQKGFGIVDYSRLEYLLSTEKWESADEETSQIILEVSRRKWLGSVEDLLGWENSLKHFPCKDLNTLDGLWLKYSDNRFGLGVQQDIFQSLQIKDFSGDWFKLYYKFFNIVGWQYIEQHQSKPIFSIHAPKGHLPSPSWMMKAGGGGKTIPWIMNGIYVFNRLETCKLH